MIINICVSPLFTHCLFLHFWASTFVIHLWIRFFRAVKCLLMIWSIDKTLLNFHFVFQFLFLFSECVSVGHAQFNVSINVSLFYFSNIRVYLVSLCSCAKLKEIDKCFNLHIKTKNRRHFHPSPFPPLFLGIFKIFFFSFNLYLFLSLCRAQ